MKKLKLTISNSTNKNKRLKAVFTDGDTTITRHFGFKGGSTYIDHKDKEKRKNYRKRHEATEKKFYKDPPRPSTLSKEAVKSYKNKFNLS